MAKIEIVQNTGGNASAYYLFKDGERGFIKQISASDLALYNEFEILPDLRHFLPKEIEIS